MGAVSPVNNITNTTHPIILFDGVCNLCTASVKFVIKYDKNKRFMFASLQSAYAQKLLTHFNLHSISLRSIVLVQGQAAFEKSDAALEVVRHLNGAWPALYIFKIVPRFLRDKIYSLIAKNRYQLFGKQESCMVPTPGLKSRFIEG